MVVDSTVDRPTAEATGELKKRRRRDRLAVLGVVVLCELSSVVDAPEVAERVIATASRRASSDINAIVEGLRWVGWSSGAGVVGDIYK